MLQMFSNGYDVVIADSLDEARTMLMDEFGLDPEDVEGEGWNVHEMGEAFTLELDESGAEETKLVSEWITENGKGILASTEL